MDTAKLPKSREIFIKECSEYMAKVILNNEHLIESSKFQELSELMIEKLTLFIQKDYKIDKTNIIEKRKSIVLKSKKDKESIKSFDEVVDMIKEMIVDIYDDVIKI